MSARDLSRTAAREVLTDSERWSSWLAGRTPVGVLFDPDRDVWTVTSTRSPADGIQDLVIGVETAAWFSRCWSVPDLPTAIRAAGAFARDPEADLLGLPDLDAIEAFERDPDSRAFLSISWASAHQQAFVAAAHPRFPRSRPQDLPEAVQLRPLDLFDKFGFNEGEALDRHVRALRAEGWCLGADELLRAVVEAKILPMLDPQPWLCRILSSHNNVRGMLEGQEELDDQDLDFLVDATTAWPASITVSTTEILAQGRETAGPLTRRIRALEAVLKE